jgi:hypothetical protein
MLAPFQILHQILQPEGWPSVSVDDKGSSGGHMGVGLSVCYLGVCVSVLPVGVLGPRERCMWVHKIDSST